MHSIKPLYRKVNTCARGIRATHHVGGDFRNTRKTQTDATWSPMSGRDDRGLDYTPLFRFLLSKVGQDWDDVFREAVNRLDRSEPIFWLVARSEQERQSLVRIGESTYYNGLYIDSENVLRIVDPSITVETMIPSCACCTHTLNGVRFLRKLEAPSLEQ